MNRPTKVIWHHSGGIDADPCLSTQHHTVDTIDDWHKTRWPGFQSRVYINKKGAGWHVGYHLVVDTRLGTITQCRAFSEEGAHTIGMNTRAIGVLVIGNYDVCSPDQIDSDAYPLINKAWEMCNTAIPALEIRDNVPHRKYANKSCFGTKYDDTFIQRVLTGGLVDTQEIVLMKKVVELLEQLVANLMVQFTGRRQK